MSAPHRRPATSRASVVGRVLAGVAAGAAGLVFLLAAWAAVSSRFGGDDRDLHGYGLIFGTVLAIVAGFVVAAVLPLAFPRTHRGRAFTVSMAAFGLTLVLLIASLLTA